MRRSKELPFGGRIGGNDLAAVRRGLVGALGHARASQRLAFSGAAAERWIEVYSDLSRGQAGMLGASTARAEANVCRLALIYALLDCANEIGIDHLEATLAVWSYAASSARWVFGDSLGDPTADDIWELAKDRPASVSRTEVRDLFSRNKKAHARSTARSEPWLRPDVCTARARRMAAAGPPRYGFLSKRPGRPDGGCSGLSVRMIRGSSE